ncbi:MAG: hypothetical protein ACM3WR_07845 [Solirubrobacterales bacterium]
MRRVAAALCLVLALAACDGRATKVSPTPSASPSPSVTASPSTTSPSVTPSLTASPTPSPTPSLELQLPADAPSEVSDPAALAAVAAGDLTALVPPEGTVVHTATLGAEGDRIVLTWRRGEDPFAAEQGFVEWRLLDGGSTWRAVSAFTDDPRKGVLGIDLETGDLTGDGVPDALTLEQQGGSGACGTWRVIVSTPKAASQGFRHAACDTEIRIDGSTLALREAVFGPDDPHCCPSAMRYATLEWDGQTFVETSSHVVDLTA